MQPPTVPTVLPPRIYRAIEALCRDALHYSDKHPTVRKLVTSVYQALEVEAHTQHGSPSIEALSLKKVLTKIINSEEDNIPSHRLVPLQLLEADQLLRPEQIEAAHHILQVWQGWGRYLQVSGRKYEKGGSKRAGTSSLGPLDVMGESTWALWREYYIPWERGARQRLVDGGGWLHARKESCFEVVMGVVVKDISPKQLDQAFYWRQGSALIALQDELMRFGDKRVKVA